MRSEEGEENSIRKEHEEEEEIEEASAPSSARRKILLALSAILIAILVIVYIYPVPLYSEQVGYRVIGGVPFAAPASLGDPILAIKRALQSPDIWFVAVLVSPTPQPSMANSYIQLAVVEFSYALGATTKAKVKGFGMDSIEPGRMPFLVKLLYLTGRCSVIYVKSPNVGARTTRIQLVGPRQVLIEGKTYRDLREAGVALRLVLMGR